MSLRAAGIPLLVIALVIAPLIVGSTWMYQASASTFAFEHSVRVAQHARDGVMKAYLATEADMRGFAATNDPYFAQRYRLRARSFEPLAATLEGVIGGVGISGGRVLIERERRTFHAWLRNVAAVIIANPRTAPSRLLRTADPAYAATMFATDERIGVRLDDASAAAESDRQRLLRTILLASVLLVLVAAGSAAILLYLRAVARRRSDVQYALYAEEQRISAMLQAALAPQQLPAIPGVTLHAIYVPAESERDVGGDWYEALALRDGRAFLTIGDVAGHGLTAAVTMNKARQAILAAAVVETEPAAILRRANRVLCSQSAGMVTAACCIFDPATGRLDYATAGHPAPIVATALGARALANGAAPLGIVDEIDIVSNAVMLAPASLVLLYTDGLLEEQRDVVAGEAELVAAAQRFRAAGDPACAIFDAVIGPRAPRDDVAVLTMTLEALTARDSERRRLTDADLPFVQRS
jgi:serine phosphatase RsbU (regulator of sigma subunit)